MQRKRLLKNEYTSLRMKLRRRKRRLRLRSPNGRSYRENEKRNIKLG